MILKPGEGYASEPQFMGVYRKSGVMIEDSGREFRYNANGSGYKPIDRNENPRHARLRSRLPRAGAETIS